jgi:CheY-like chemotaxis protein
MLAVTDTGVGMDEKTKSQVFEPFFTTKQMGRGTGLGLSTVYGIIKQSGGNIWIYSEPGIGTTFKVYLPRTNEAPAESSDAREPGRHPTGTETILVVEDEDGVRGLIRGVLQMAGYTVIDTSDVDEAIAICADTNRVIHLLLTDVVMPKMGGKQLAERVTRTRPDIKVVFMSGYTDNAIVHHGVLDAGTAFIEKPISPHLLLERLRHYLG